MVERSGDYLMLAKGDQARLAPRPPSGLPRGQRLDRDVDNHATVDSRHGCLMERRLTAGIALAGDRDGPELAHVFRLERGVLSRTISAACRRVAAQS